MNTEDHADSMEEQLFIIRALAAAEKAERVSRIKRIAVSAVAVAVAVWLAIKAPGPKFDPQDLLMILLFALAACTHKVLALNNKNTKVILDAIAHLQRQSRSARQDVVL